MENEILELNEQDKVQGQIYRITNIVTKKVYIGQTLSHYKNKGKYRPYGYIGRYNSHISEAISNTKQKQCTYLNNSIRKHGKEKFIVELIKRCDVSDLDEEEQFCIDKYKTLYPKGYNLTKGGKTTEFIKVENNQELNEVKKRGRDFGYVHNAETKKKMSQRLKVITSSDKVRNRMKDTMEKFYDNKKIEILKGYTLSDDYEKYIKPVRKKNTDTIHDYIIRIEDRTLTLRSENESLTKKYDRLKNILAQVKELQGKNC